MLAMLTQTQIVSEWEKIRQAIQSLPDIAGTPEKDAFILNGLMQGKIQGWQIIEGNEVRALILTSISGEIGVFGRTLTINAMVGKDVSDEEYRAGIGILREYAKKMSCHILNLQTNNTRIYDIMVSLGKFSQKIILSMEV